MPKVKYLGRIYSDAIEYKTPDGSQITHYDLGEGRHVLPGQVELIEEGEEIEDPPVASPRRSRRPAAPIETPAEELNEQPG